MASTRKGPLNDFCPNHKSAGASTTFEDSNTEKCLKPSEPGQETPPHIKKYRKSYKTQAGTKILHYGIADDKIPVENNVFGKKSLPSDHVNDIFQNRNEGIKELIQDIQENKYASRIREPLGKPMERNHILPEETKSVGFKYGVATKINEYNAKEVIFPSDQQILDNEEDRIRYVKTHGWFEPGEQKQRNYNWPVDKNEFRFGKCEKFIPNEAYYVLNPEESKDAFPKTKIIQKNVADFKDFKEEPLGKPRNLGQTSGKMDENIVFGKSLQKRDEWNAGKCIRGEATIQEAYKDEGLGKSTKFGGRNIPKESDSDRIFGVPTIRTDIKKPQMKSVADPNNYGDEPPVIHLLFPQKFAEMGLSEEDFSKLRTKNEIEEIFKAAGLSYKIGKFLTIYNRALEIEKSYDKVSVRSFLQAVSEIHHIA